jgi:SAM-dependent methyltransferase
VKEQAGLHYRDEYWNDLPRVIAHLCKRSTGDETVWWMDHLKRTYATAPFRRALVPGCGNGWAERDLYDRGIAEHFDAFDASPEYLKVAEEKRGSRSVAYSLKTFEEFAPVGTYDLIVNVAALHHVRYLYRMIHLLAGALAPGGLFVHWEYVGPSRNQYSDHHLATMRAVNEALPPRFRTRHPLRHDLSAFLRGDPTEAIHAADIVDALGDEFEFLEHKVLGGGIAYQILWNNLAEFRKDDPEARATLDWLLRLDASMTDTGLVPPLFAFIVGRRRVKPDWKAPIARLVEPFREKFAELSGGRYPMELYRAASRAARQWRSFPRSDQNR